MDCLEYLQSKDIGINEKWIDMADRIVLILPKTLCHILNIPGMMKFNIYILYKLVYN